MLMIEELRTYGYVEIVDTKVKDFISELPPFGINQTSRVWNGIMI